MPQLTVMIDAVSAASATVRGDASARRISVIFPDSRMIAPAIGTDQTMRCATTSAAGMCATAFM